MNLTERDYAARLDLLRGSGEILQWGFEGLTLRLAADVRYTPDFMVIRPLGTGFCRLEAHEVKGHMQDDARVKVRVAAALFPWLTFFIVRRAKGTSPRLGRWDIEEVPRGELAPDERLHGLKLEESFGR